MNDSIVFSEEQKAVLLALASRWLDTALQAERLAEEHPKEEEKFPLLRRAAHYRDSAVELQMLVELGDLPCKDTMSFAEKTKRDATARAWVMEQINQSCHQESPKWHGLEKFSAEGIGLARKLFDHLLEKGASWSEAEPELRRLFERISATSAE